MRRRHDISRSESNSLYAIASTQREVSPSGLISTKANLDSELSIVTDLETAQNSVAFLEMHYPEPVRRAFEGLRS